MSNTETKIRPAEREDVVRIVALNAALFREDAGQRDPFTDQGWPEREGREYFTALLAQDDSVGLLAEAGDEVVGYLVGYVGGGSSLRPVRVAELESMYVSEKYRGRGVGARLVGEFLRWSRKRGAERASVTAYAANERAVRFYERSGFRPKSLTLEVGIG